MKIGICGVGGFGSQFIHLFKAHPQVEEVVLADLFPDRLAEIATTHGLTRTYPSLDALCASDVDAVGIFTQRELHAPQAMQALAAGKDVFTAIPPALTVEAMGALIDATVQSGRLLMVAETSYYYPITLYARKRWLAGDFGRFVHADAHYLHDLEFMYKSFTRSGGDRWKWVAGIPPMLYSSHSLSAVLAVTEARVTEVACVGQEDQHPDGIYRRGANQWDNIYSNEVALMRTSDGGTIRLSEMRRVGWDGPNGVAMSMYGTGGSLEQNTLGTCWVQRKPHAFEDVTALMQCSPRSGGEGFNSTTAIHPVDRLPASYRGLTNGHHGSHYFLVDDFVQAVVRRTQPPCHIWNGARWTLPGLVAHASAEQGGAWLPVPDFGDPPEGYLRP